MDKLDLILVVGIFFVLVLIVSLCLCGVGFYLLLESNVQESDAISVLVATPPININTSIVTTIMTTSTTTTKLGTTTTKSTAISIIQSMLSSTTTTTTSTTTTTLRFRDLPPCNNSNKDTTIHGVNCRKIKADCITYGGDGGDCGGWAAYGCERV